MLVWLSAETLGQPAQPAETQPAASQPAATQPTATQPGAQADEPALAPMRSETGSDNGMARRVIARKLLKGFGFTLLIAGASLAIGFAAAVPLGIVLNTHTGPLRYLLYYPVRTIIDFIRGTPVLVQLFFVYFGLPMSPLQIELSAVAAAILTLSVNSTAYMAEVIRSGLMSVDRGQKLAGRALGLSKLQVFLFIIWPQAFRIAVPPLMNSVVALTKDTALVSMISVREVIMEAQSIIAVTYDPEVYYLIVAVMFFVVTFPLMKLAELLETRMRKRGFAHD